MKVRDLMAELERIVAERPDVFDLIVVAGIESEGTNYRVGRVVVEPETNNYQGCMCFECPANFRSNSETV